MLFQTKHLRWVHNDLDDLFCYMGITSPEYISALGSRGVTWPHANVTWGWDRDYIVVSIERQCRHLGLIQPAMCSTRIPGIKWHPPEDFCMVSPSPTLLWWAQHYR